jgi:glucose-fructose oxidoreductase
LASQQPKQLDEDALSIIEKKHMIVPGEEGLRDIRVVEAIYKSVKTGGVVKL